jgi:hypothetical protein
MGWNVRWNKIKDRLKFKTRRIIKRDSIQEEIEFTKRCMVRQDIG